jgi:hypothetical protein
MTPYRDFPVAQSDITRPQKNVLPLFALAVLLAMACIAFALAPALGLLEDTFLAVLGALLCGASAVGVVFGSVLGGVGSAPCPACGAQIEDLERRGSAEGILCQRCNHFLESKGGKLRVTAPDTVADMPVFGAALPERFYWPPGCVVCGAPPTQDLPIRIQKTDVAESVVGSMAGLAVGGLIGVGFVVRSGKRIALHVPHCRDHDDGAVLAQGGPTEFMILFRSYPYQRAFCELNSAASIESPATGRSARAR